MNKTLIPLVGIPDIEDSLASASYPGDLRNFQVRIAQSIVRNKSDRIFASNSQRKSFLEIGQFYQDNGLDKLIIPQENIEFVTQDEKCFLSQSVLDQLRENPKAMKALLKGTQLEPYINMKNTDEIADKTGVNILRRSDSVEIINNKSIAQKELRELGVLCPEGKTVYSHNDAYDYFINLNIQGYKYISFKLSNSINGLGVFKLERMLQLVAKLDEFKDEIANGILMDGWIDDDVVGSPNIQFFVGKTPSEDRLIACSDQLLVDGGKEHIGNISDLSILDRDPRLVSDIIKILNWIRSKQGYGVIGLDFLSTKVGDEYKTYFIEINGRYNGSTHGAVIADKLEKTNWATCDGVLAPERDFNKFIERLEGDKILYKDGCGVIPVNPATIDGGKAMVVIMGNSRQYIENILFDKLGFNAK